MTAPLAIATRHGYAAAAPLEVCGVPIGRGRLHVTRRWVTHCFLPAYNRARAIWGTHASAIDTEILSALAPAMRVRAPETGAERELRRRVQLAVAVLLNQEGAPTRYPADPSTPRPRLLPEGPPWYRSLMTGWAR